MKSAANILLCVLAVMLTASLAAQVKVSARFEPLTAVVGQRVNYVLEVEGSEQPPSGQIPAVEGIQIGNTCSTSRQQSFHSINGRTEFVKKIAYSFPVAVSKEGTFVVPSWSVEIEGKKYRVPAATLQVNPPGEALRNAVFLEIHPPVRQMYVGQSIPVEVRLRVREDVRHQLTSLPEMTGDAFTAGSFSEQNLRRYREFSNGIPYVAYSWPYLLTAVKAGKQTIKLQENIALADPQPGRRASQRDIFDSFFQGRFDSLENRTVFSGDIIIEVLEMPQEGKPASFSGAIGDFQLESVLSTRTVQVGDPLTLTVTLSGEGNFERIAAPVMVESKDWRVYPPKVEFYKTDELGYRGKKVFEYILRPESLQASTIPILQFAYFHPQEKAYFDLSTKPETIVVKANPNATVSLGATTAAGSSELRMVRRPLNAAPLGLLSISLEPGTFGPGLVPFFRQPAFWAWQAVPALGLLVMAGWHWGWRRRRIDVGKVRRQQAREGIQVALEESRRAEKRADAPGYFAACQKVLQHAVLPRLNKATQAEVITWADLEPLLPAVGLSEADRALAREVFLAVDSSRFAGGLLQMPPNVGQHRRKVEEIADRLCA